MTTLLQTKVTIPASRPILVSRDRLLQRLNDLYQHKLALISTPAGFGKTTLLAAFALQATTTRSVIVGWLSLGADDNDPVRFTAYLLESLAVAGLTLSPAPDQLTDLVNEVTAVLTSQPNTHLILVLDDYHLITNKAIHEMVAFLLEHMPQQMHLIVATRSDPPLSLARWRARGQLIELRQQDLRFSEEETANFLKQVMGLDLPSEDVQTLNNRTEGWIAGLQMAGVSLKGEADTAVFIQSFSGSHRYILDYLMEEVLTRQSAEVTDFLLKTAVLERFCAELCDDLRFTIYDLRLDGGSVVNRKSEIVNSPSQTILEQLDTANLFLVPLDNERRWFRYHRLFADLLRQRLVQLQPEHVPVIHQQAAQWFEENDYPEEAIRHALLGDTVDQAARLIEAVAESKLMRSELVTVKGWLDALPARALQKRPSLSFYYAWTLIMEGLEQAKVEQVLSRVSAKGSPGEQELVRSFLAVLRADGATATALAQQALTALAPDRAFFRSAGTWILGMSLLLSGKLEQGEEALEQAVQMSRQMGNLTIAAAALGRLANQAWRQCDLYRAKQIYEQALVLATDEAERPLPVAGETHIGLARLYYEWNDLETALHHAETGLDLMVRWREISTVVANIWLARITQAQGDAHMANQFVHRARQVAQRTKGTEFDDIAVAMTEAQLHLLQGNLESVAAWCAQRQVPSTVDTAALQQFDDITEGHLRKYEFIMLARLRLAQKRPDDALAILPPLLKNVQHLQRRDLQLEIHLLTAVAHHLKHDYAQSSHHLQRALTLGESGNLTRIFIEASPEMASLLSRCKPTNQQNQTYLNHLLNACGSPATRHSPPATLSPLIEPLSPREIEVLSLIAEGLSNKEIAQKLVLSLPTIKWHTSNIYGKLGVGNRVTAVTRARELHILS